MIAYFSSKITLIAEKFLPSTFVITLILTVIISILSIAFTSSTPIEVVDHWYKGFWELLAFTMQMALVLVFGYALASTEIVNNFIDRVIIALDSLPKALAYISFFSMFVGFINWGLGLVFGAILARKFAEFAKKNNIKINYPLIGASAFCSLLVWHGGLSASSSLTIATEAHFLSNIIGIIPVTETLFSIQNISVSIAILILVPWTLYFFAKKISPKPFILNHEVTKKIQNDVIYFNDIIDNSTYVNRSMGLLILCYLINLALNNGTSLQFINLNFVNMTLLSVGLILHKSINAYIDAIENVAKSAAGIILLFPFYAGIMGIMKYSGLTVIFSELMVQFSIYFNHHFGLDVFPLMAFVSSGLVNLFVPSGGGQWAVQGPILMQSAIDLKSNIPQIVMAFSYGDQITNMLQPFWALPLLGITGLKAKEILPYTFIIMLISIPIYLIGIYLF